MRIVFALAALLGLSSLALAAPTEWLGTVTARPDGAYVVGNPAARVKLVEWASYTCPHCREFAEQSRPTLEGRMIRSGQVSLEVRHYIFNAPDFAAVAVARCGGPSGFMRRHHAIFAAQEKWSQAAAAFMQANAAILQSPQRHVAFRRIADASGLSAIGRASGLTPTQLTACFTPAALQRVGTLGDPPAEVASTPSFYVNGRLVTRADWAALEPQLRAAGVR